MMSNCSFLQGKVVIVTGGGGRLGQGLCTGFTEAGAHVITAGNEGTEDLILDLSSETEVAEAFAKVQRERGRVDVLVHAVGMWNEWPLLETGLKDWERMMRVNLTTAFLCFREAVRHMAAGGTIIGICARSGLEAAGARGGAYAASKAGLLRLVEAVAAEYPALNVCALAPSVIHYRDTDAPGVHADDLVQMAMRLCSEPARALSGTVLQAYGTR